MILSLNKEIVIRPAISICDYMFIRRLRNKVRMNMTGFTGEISCLRQIGFWIFKPDDFQLYVASIKSKRVAYLLLKMSDGNCLITEAVDESYRNMGIGSSLIDFAKTKSNTLRAEILKTNTCSLELHKKNGFKYILTYGRMEIYEYCDQKPNLLG